MVEMQEQKASAVKYTQTKLPLRPDNKFNFLADLEETEAQPEHPETLVQIPHSEVHPVHPGLETHMAFTIITAAPHMQQAELTDMTEQTEEPE